MAHPFGEFFPIARAVRVEYPGGLKRSRIECGPTQRITHSFLLKNDRTVTRNGHIQSLGHDASGIDRVFAHLDLFVTYFSVAPSGRGEITIRIVLIEFFEVEVLNVWPKIGRAPGDVIVMAQNDARSAGKSHPS